MRNASISRLFRSAHVSSERVNNTDGFVMRAERLYLHLVRTMKSDEGISGSDRTP